MGKKGGAVASPPPVEAKEEEPPEPEGEQLEGDFIFADKSTYSGQYLKVNDDVCLHGQGLLTTGPETFQGSFEKGQYKEGKYTACSGAVYNGAFRNNLFHGRGEYIWPDQRAYKGMWKDGYMHGRGQFLNFSLGVDKSYSGFALDGRFSSNKEEQEEMKTQFINEYRADVSRSATSALKDLAGKMTPDGAPKEYLVPVPAPAPEGEDEDPKAAADRLKAAAEREAILEIVVGPFPEAATLQQAGVQAVASRFEADAERPLVPDILEERNLASSRFDREKRLMREQLQMVGQCVEFAVPDAEAGAVNLVVFVNVSKEYDVAKARWKVVHYEEVSAVG